MKVLGKRLVRFGEINVLVELREYQQKYRGKRKKFKLKRVYASILK